MPVVRALEARGLRCVVPELPLTSLRADVDTVARLIRAQAAGDPPFVVGHSYGGS